MAQLSAKNYLRGRQAIMPVAAMVALRDPRNWLVQPEKQETNETSLVGKALASRLAAQCQVYRCTPDMGQDVQRWESFALLERP